MKKIAVVFLLCITIFPISITGQTRYRNVTWEKFQKSGPGLKQMGLLAVRKSSDIKSSIFSVGCETLDRDYAKFSVYKDYVGELGVKHARLQSGWAKCEKQKGIYSFEWLDSCVYGLNNQSVKPWICLCYGNPVYGSEIGLGAGVAALAYNEEAMAGWLKYVEITVKRYKDVVNEWEVWNEPYGQEKDYAPLLIKTAELIRKIQPDAIVLGEILWDPKTPEVRVLLDALKSKGKLDIVDYWAYHPYVPNPDDCYPILDEFVTLLKSYNPNFKVYQGETGCPAQLEWTHALDYYPWTEYSQAKWDLRRMAGDRVRNIPTSIFTMIDLKYTNMLQSFGLIRSNLLHEIIYKRPSYYGVQHMTSFFDDEVKAVGELKYESDSPRKMTVAGFKKNEQPVILVWYKDQIPSDELKFDLVNLNVKGVKFQDPVFVEMITGRVYEIDKSKVKISGENTSITALPVWDSPVMISERSLVNLKTD
jgi:hypothetical protein